MANRSLAWAVLVCLLLFTACGPKPVQTAAKPVVPVTAAKAIQKNVPVQLRLIGTVQPFITIAVKAQIGGDLTRVYFTEGQDVKKGAMLFQIDPRPYQQAVSQAEATLARDMAQIEQAQANLSRDISQSKNAGSQAERYQRLAKEGIVSKEQNDQFHTNAAALEDTIRADQAAITSAKAAVAADRANVDTAKLNVTYCSIRSPIDGRTGNLLVKQGNLVKANADTAMVVINQIAPIYVAFSVPEEQLADIRKYMARRKIKVEAVIPNDSGAPIPGVLTFIDNSVDNTTGTIQMKATFANAERRLWPGRFVNVVVTLATESNITVVPSEAIQTGQQGQYAFVVKPDNTVENRVVTVGRTVGRDIVVEKGIQPGETVVVDGQLRLVPGASVQIVKSPAGGQS
ncbi:MAG: efflux RND transporter periplasmic adaptor subunit [Acidobacteriota bacterium]|nr:efflux RND transporter periplasmic adaptor subunit [Acidobacteriota bacterium]